MERTVQLVLFDLDGSVFHSYEAEVVSATLGTVVIRVADQDEDYFETYSTEDGRCLDDRCPLEPHYVLIDAKNPIENSWLHLPESWWQS